MMDERVAEFHSRFAEVFAESQRYCFVSRDRELQVDQRDRLVAFAGHASILKQQMVAANDESSANAILGLELMIEAIIEEMEMWIAIKDEQWDSAWDHLMDSQSAAGTAVRVHPDGEAFKNYTRYLHLLEQLLFPPQTFLSRGEIVDQMECSICGQVYGECDHIAGKVYMGQICAQVIREIKSLTEVSIVDHPADKRCRVLNFTNDGVKKDVMTWRVMPANSEEEDADGKFKISGYAARTRQK